MKRILSIFLCVVMLASMFAMTVSAANADTAATITNENVMTFTTDKDSYMPGDKVTITVAMESIWGDPDIVDTVKGFEDYGEMPGAYGMQILCSNLIYDPSVFTAAAYTNLLQNGSTILNADANEIAWNANNPIEARKNGCQYIGILSDYWSADYSCGGFFNGSGTLWQYNLTISANAAEGTYYLPVGPYRITTADAGDAVIKFQGDDRYFAWNGNVNSLYEKVPVTYKANYTGDSRVDTEAGFGTDYECSYVVINIGGDGPIDPPIPPEPEDPMSFELSVDKTDLIPGDIITATLDVKNNEGLSSANATISFNNTDLKLIEVASPLEGITDLFINYDAANKLGTFDKKGTPVETNAFFDGTTSYADDGTVLTVKFEVLSTAEGGDSAITVTNLETGLEATANAVIAGDHVHSFTETTTPADCTTKGKVEQICDCGLTYHISDISALGHTYDENSTVVVVPATCESEGRTATLCDVCGKSANTVTHQPLGHDLKTVTTPLTCTTDETSQEVCQREGCTYKTEPVIINSALAHKNSDGTDAWGEEQILKKPTTNAAGYYGVVCALCGTEKSTIPIPMLPVVYGNCDMDPDNKINLSDITVLLKYIAKWDDIYFSPENADVNVDGRVNVIDASTIMKYIAKWDISFGTEVDKVG